MRRLPRPRYEEGVVSPLVAHAHPYPTRYHGGIWTRPVFGFPWVTVPTNVHQESDMRGLGMVVDTGDGLFLRPTGAPSYGGGIFDGNQPMSGLGQTPGLAPAPRPRRVTSVRRPDVSGLGSLGGNVLGAMLEPARPVRDGIFTTFAGTGMPMYQAMALGALPANCKTVAAFNTCDNQQFQRAQTYCYGLRDTQGGSYAPYASFDACVGAIHDTYLEENCAKYCPAGGGLYPWGQFSQKTVELQTEINLRLAELGYQGIGTDGKLGATTCGAARFVVEHGALLDVPPSCQSYAFTPVPAGQAVCPAWQGMTTSDCNVASGRPSALIKKMQAQLGVPQTGVLDRATCTAWHTKVPKCGTLSPCPLNLVNIQDFVSGACKPRLCEPYSAYPFPPDPCAAPACGPDEELVDGKCVAKAQPVKSSMMWLGLGALGLLAAGAYALSQKKPKRRSSRRAA